jgi:hypothetical protein
MPLVEFDTLPGDARVWVFAAAHPLAESSTDSFLRAVDAFLASWKAHGHPLRAARMLRDNQFLAIGVDQSTEGASGCSIDGLFRALKEVQSSVGRNFLEGGRIYWRGADGVVKSGTRAEFGRQAGSETVVFDTTVTDAASWREAFERPARDSWHERLLKSHASQ